jgi:hypothetical protein
MELGKITGEGLITLTKKGNIIKSNLYLPALSWLVQAG